MIVTPNTPEVWGGLLERHGAVQTFHGDPEADYDATGAKEWAHLLTLLPDRASVLEWGAGDGRITQYAWPDCGEYVAYEPMEACRACLVERVSGQPVTIVGPELLEQDGAGYTAIFCWNVLHHCDYDDVWQLARFGAANLSPGGQVLVQYIGFNGHGLEYLRDCKDTSAWPVYVWHTEQLRGMFAAAGLQFLSQCNVRSRLAASFTCA